MIAVGASTIGIPYVPGYATNLDQIVGFTGFGILAVVTSDRFADMNHWALWPIVGIVNIMVFAIPGVGLWLAGQKRWPLWCSIAILA
jgi:hypothetical protein